MNEEKSLEKEIERVDQLIDENLPHSINGFQLRRFAIDKYAILTYSKDGNYLLKLIRQNGSEIK